MGAAARGLGSTGHCKLPLPWKSAERQPCHGFNESVIMDVARAMAASPLKAAGYQYVSLGLGC